MTHLSQPSRRNSVVYDVTIYVSVYQEVENRIEGLREMLSKKLMIMPSSVEEQKRLIR